MPFLRAGGRDFDCDALLLDKDGTLLDFKAMWLEWSRYVIEEITAAVGPRSVPRRAMEAAMGIDLAAWQVDPEGPLAGGSMSGLRDALMTVLHEHAGMREAEAEDLVMSVARRSETAMDWESLTKPVPGLQAKLEHLRVKNFKLAVVTADSATRSKISLAALQLIDYFDAIIGADMVESSKPAPDMALLACRMLGVEPARAVVVGDTPRDIVMAKQAGSASIGVLSGVCTREQLAGADAVVDSVVELTT